jgi:hypothetical protein
MNPQVRFADKGIWPSTGDEFFLADNFAGALDQSDQNVEGATTQSNGFLSFEKDLPRWQQAEGTERDFLFAQDGSSIHHPQAPFSGAA